MREGALVRVLGRLAIVVVSILLATASAAACGSGADAPQGEASAPARTLLTSQEWGFSLSYPSRYLRAEPPVDPQADPGLLYQVLLADPAGAKRGDTALDVLAVYVRRIRPAAKPGDLRAHRSDFAAMVMQLIGRPDGLKLVQRPRMDALGGHPALKAEYTSRIKGADVAAISYLVPIGDRVYWVTGQASRATWDSAGRGIGSALASMKLD